MKDLQSKNKRVSGWTTYAPLQYRTARNGTYKFIEVRAIDEGAGFLMTVFS